MRAFMVALVCAALVAGAAHAGPANSECPKGDALLGAAPTDLSQIAGIVPLGNLNPASNHVVPTDHIYFYPKMTTPGLPSTAIDVKVVSPGKAELVAVEYHPGASPAEPEDWTLHMRPCKEVSFYFHHIRTLSAPLLAAIGPLDESNSVNLGEFRAKPVSIVLNEGEFIGAAKTFDLGLHDFRKTPQPFVNPARYAIDLPVLIASVPSLAADPLAAVVAPRIVPQSLYARCPIAYFKLLPRAAMTARLSAFSGTPLASGIPKCHSHMQDVPGTAQGNWWPDFDPVHDKLFEESKAIALVNWNVDPTAQLFSFTRNTPGLTLALFDSGTPASALDATFEFPVRAGPQRTNRRFSEINDAQIYCYDLVRIQHGGPHLRGVILLQLGDGPGGPKTRLDIEFVAASRCPALPTPWSFGPGKASFYR